jgi:hypothetical protein
MEFQKRSNKKKRAGAGARGGQGPARNDASKRQIRFFDLPKTGISSFKGPEKYPY